MSLPTDRIPSDKPRMVYVTDETPEEFVTELKERGVDVRRF